MSQAQAKRTSRQVRRAGSPFVAGFMDKSGIVDVERVANAFRMTKGQLAETAGLGVATISKSDRRSAPRTQTRVTEMLEIISRVRDWAGGEAQAMAWYRSQPIPALDGRTPEALGKSGKGAAIAAMTPPGRSPPCPARARQSPGGGSTARASQHFISRSIS